MSGAPEVRIVDTHCHTWDASCPYVSGTAYLPSAVMPLEGLLAQWDTHAVSWGVLVQPSFLGADNGYLLRALHAHPERLRGVIIAEPARDLASLDALHAAGVRGFRFNLISGAPLPDLTSAVWSAWLEATRARGWHIVVAGSSAQLAHGLPALIDTGLPLVIDHWGLPEAGTGAADRLWQRCLVLAGQHPIWFKLSAPYRLAGVPAATLLPPLLAALGTARLLWGSDWPCTRHEACQDFAQLRRLPMLPAGGPTPEQLLQHCAANAVALYQA